MKSGTRGVSTSTTAIQYFLECLENSVRPEHENVAEKKFKGRTKVSSYC